MEKRYERRGKARSCFLDQEDLLNLARLVQETFTRPEIERYFRVSTTLNQTRVFANSMGDFLVQKELPDKINDLSFWIEGWDRRTRFDKNVLLDFSKYSVELHVEGTDPVWVYDKYHRIMKFLRSKAAWYWPVMALEKILTFTITMFLIVSLLLAFESGEPIYHFGKLALLGVWTFLTFYDTRKICPYSALRLRGREALLEKENLFMAAISAMFVLVILQSLQLPFFLK